jgi:hypothetical protein
MTRTPEHLQAEIMTDSHFIGFWCRCQPAPAWRMPGHPKGVDTEPGELLGGGICRHSRFGEAGFIPLDRCLFCRLLALVTTARGIEDAPDTLKGGTPNCPKLGQPFALIWEKNLKK